MTRCNGMVLIIALVFLLVMSLLISAMLLVSQLSHKSAYAGQQQLQTTQDALAQHIIVVNTLADDNDVDRQRLTACPASYAAWSDGAVKCEIIKIDTAAYSDNRLFYAGYSSLVLRAALILELD